MQAKIIKTSISEKSKSMSSILWRILATLLVAGITTTVVVPPASAETTTVTKTKVTLKITCPSEPIYKIPAVSVDARLRSKDKPIKVDVLFSIDGELDKTASVLGYKLKKGKNQTLRMVGVIKNVVPNTYTVSIKIFPYKKRGKPYATQNCFVIYS